MTFRVTEPGMKNPLQRALRRLALLCLVSSFIVGLLACALLSWAVATDWYPVVPTEGFSTGRKIEEVLVGTLTGAIAGAAAGAATFVLRLLIWDVWRR